jgi:hypothetical protein
MRAICGMMQLDQQTSFAFDISPVRCAAGCGEFIIVMIEKHRGSQQYLQTIQPVTSFALNTTCTSNGQWEVVRKKTIIGIHYRKVLTVNALDVLRPSSTTVFTRNACTEVPQKLRYTFIIKCEYLYNTSRQNRKLNTQDSCELL